MIDIISATRLSEQDFWNHSALGISLRRLRLDTRLVPRLSFENRRGLPDIYNAAITAEVGSELLLFVHDDVWLDDYYLCDRVIEGLRAYDVIGVAGNRRRASGQPGWAFLDTRWTWDEKSNLSGAVAHAQGPFAPVSFFGPAPAECELLDGVLLAARKSTLKGSGVLFDPRFEFHFYDMDFCRTARQCNLRLGTWPVCITHQSRGSFGTPEWNEKLRAYLEKWES